MEEDTSLEGDEEEAIQRKTHDEYKNALVLVSQLVSLSNTWDELMEQLHKALESFTGESKEASTRRRHLLHCSHNVTFEDFAFLLFGPLTYGVFYMPSDAQQTSYQSKKNFARNFSRNEMKLAVNKIIQFDEFKLWKNKPCTVQFVELVLEDQCSKIKKYKPIGYLTALYRIRMVYKKWLQKYENQAIRNATLGAEDAKLLSNIMAHEWDSFAKDMFSEQAAYRLQEAHLDEWDDRTCTVKKSATKTNANIESKEIAPGASIVVLKNVFSNPFLRTLKGEVNNNARFMEYSTEDEVNKHNGRRIRIASRKKTEFLVGKGKKTKRYGSSEEMIPCEEKLMTCVQKLQRLYIAIYFAIRKKVLKEGDQIQWVKDLLGSGGYSYHNDQAGTCCTVEGDPMVEDDPNDPSRMIVATVVLASATEKTTTAVTWEDTARQNSITFNTGDNYIHLQLVSVQTCSKHKVDPLPWAKNNATPVDWRLVASFRATMHYQQSPKMIQDRVRMHMFGTSDIAAGCLPPLRKKYIKTNVLRMLQHEELTDQKEDGECASFSEEEVEEPDPIDDERKMPAKKTTKQGLDEQEEEKYERNKSSNPTNKRGRDSDETYTTGEMESQSKQKKETKRDWPIPIDTYSNAPHDHKNDPIKQYNPVIFNQVYYKLGTSRDFYEAQIEDCVYYEVVAEQNNERKKVIYGPFIWNGKVAQVGDRIPTAVVEEYIGIKHGAKEGGHCWNTYMPNGILIKHAYKNDAENIYEMLKSKKSKTFWIGLTGGSGETRGEKVVNSKRATTNCESGYFPKQQEYNRANIALLEVGTREGVVDIFFLDRQKIQESIYLGCFWLYGPETRKTKFKTLQEVAVRCPLIKTEDEHFMRYQEVNHPVVVATPYNIKTNETWKKIVVHETDVIPIGVFGANVGQPQQILGLNNIKSVSISDVTHRFVKNKEWRELLENFNEHMDDITFSPDNAGDDSKTGMLRNTAAQKIKVTEDDFMSLMACISVAVFYRLLEMNISKGMATPLRNNSNANEALGSILQLNSTPSPVRLHDVGPLNLARATNSLGNGRQQRNGVEWMTANPTECKDFLFATFIVSITGRMSPFSQWAKYKESKNIETAQVDVKKVIQFPLLRESKHFQDFIRSATSKKTKSMGQFISDQYKKSLPNCKSSVNAYLTYVNRLTTHIDNIYKNLIFTLSKEGATKEKLVYVVRTHLMELSEGGDLLFVASQIVYNLDEIIDVLPGMEWNYVHMGFGARSALNWLRNDENQTDIDILRCLLSKLEKEMDTITYDSLGIQKIKDNNGHQYLVVKLNQRRIGLQDMEHMVCKLWIIMVRYIGARPSKNPKLHRGHLHPVRLQREGVTLIQLYGADVLSVAVAATTTFEMAQKRRNNTVKIPDYFEKWK